VVNSTVYSNSALGGAGGTGAGAGAGLGGGIFVLNAIGSIVNSTLAGNTTSTGGMGGGGALHVASVGAGTPSASVTAANSIFSGSMPSGSGDIVANQVNGTVTLNLGTKNLSPTMVYNPGGATVTAPTMSDPMLGTFMDNGGPTFTLAPMAGSPAIGMGDSTTCTNGAGGVDQRGAARPAACSIGSYETVTLAANGTACTTNGQCSSLRCIDGVCCATACGCGDATDCQSCLGTQTGGTSGTCGTVTAAAAYVCHTKITGSDGTSCDNNVMCNGVLTTCPPDTFQLPTSVCRPAVTGTDGTTCDVPELCTGSTPNCPADNKLPMNTVCRAPAAGKVCDVAEVCDGTHAACPPDVGTTNTALVCRISAGVCDVAEHCDGSTPNCPTDQFMPSSQVCRASIAVCDKPESCTGAGPNCPADGLYLTSDNHQCRAASPTNDCSVASICNGSGLSCPTTWAPAATACRKTVNGALMCGACNTAGSCLGPYAPSGNGTTCP
jgi:hypothetical protein